MEDTIRHLGRDYLFRLCYADGSFYTSEDGQRFLFTDSKGEVGLNGLFHPEAFWERGNNEASR